MNNTCKYFQLAKPLRHAPSLLTLGENQQAWTFQLEHCGFEQGKQKSSRSTPHRHEVYHIVLYTAGSGHFCVEDELLPFAPGTLALTSPNQFHDFFDTSGGACTYCELTFSYRSGTKELVQPFEWLLSTWSGLAVELVPPHLLLSAPSAIRMKTAFQSLLRVLHSPEAERWFEAYRRCEAIFTEVLHALRGNTSAPVSDPLDAARDYIERNYHSALTIDDLARRVHMSPSHFQRRFRAQFDTSPLAWQQHLRLHAACRLLSTTSLQIQEIAHRVGYENALYFSRVFSRAFDQSPRQWRLDAMDRQFTPKPGRS